MWFRRSYPARLATAISLLVALVATGCGGPASAPARSPGLTLYTCVTDSTAQAAIQSFEQAHPDNQVDLFRAPTGQLNARIAGDVRSGGLRADVVWGCDPLTMQDYVDQGLVGGWIPETDIPAGVKTRDYVGVAMLYLVAVSGRGVPAVTRWASLTGPDYASGVAIPDPRVAASALGALGYFASAPGFGTDYYAALAGNGAVQVSTPDEVTNGVADGTYRAGMTIANSAYAAQESGSPIEVSWPRPGAIGVYGPVAISRTTPRTDAARAFVEFVTSRDGQTVIGRAGSYPTLPGVAGPTKPADAPVVYPDWSSLGRHKSSLLEAYGTIFGG